MEETKINEVAVDLNKEPSEQIPQEEVLVQEPIDLKSEPRPVGRPSSYSQELADRICAKLSEGESLRTVCKGDDMPSTTTVFSWFRLHPEFLSQYARAKEESADALTDEILDIADDGSNDWMEVHKGGYKTSIVDQEAVQRSKLRVDTRKWIASKMKPKKYGDKVDVTSDGKAIQGNSVTFINSKTNESASK